MNPYQIVACWAYARTGHGVRVTGQTMRGEAEQKILMPGRPETERS